MAFISVVPEDEMPDVCTADGERFGYLPNFARLFAHRPTAYAAWKQLNGAIKEAMDERRYELATVAAARRLGSSYCALAHGKVLADRFHTAPEVAAIARDHRSAGLDEIDVAVMDFAERVAADANSIAQADVDRLRELGLSDEDVLDVVLAAAVRCFFSKTLDALGVEPDAAYNELEPALKDSLTVGRAIAST
jgi:uncharacterized peroxidase-related enzyme